MQHTTLETTVPEHIEGPAAWRGSDMAASTEWIETLNDAEIAEIETSINAFQASGQGLDRVSEETFPLPTLGPRLKKILDDVLHGRGFVLVRGFPVDRYTMEQKAIAYLGIGSYLGTFRSQNAAGHLLGHVKDTGASIKKPQTRFYQTNRGLEYHTDSCDIVGLMCLNRSKSGGESRIVSSVSVYNEMMKQRPDLAAVLFNAFPTDRRGEVPEGCDPWFDVPVFNWFENQLTTIYVGQYIRSAQELFPEARRLTDKEIEAIDFMDTLTNDPKLCLEMEFLPGDMQFLHNHQILHSRTDFEDWPEPERKRHLLRLWLAPTAGRALPASFATRYGSLAPGERGGVITRDTKLTFALNPV